MPEGGGKRSERTESVRHAYAVLGVSRGSSPLTVKKRYRDLVKKWHPDLFVFDPTGARLANQQLRIINRAFHVVTEDLRGVDVCQLVRRRWGVH